MRVSPIAHAGNLHVKVCGIHGIWALRMAALHVYCATLIQTLMVLKCAKHILQRPTHNESAARMSWSYHMLAGGDHNDACRDLRRSKAVWSHTSVTSHRPCLQYQIDFILPLTSCRVCSERDCMDSKLTKWHSFCMCVSFACWVDRAHCVKSIRLVTSQKTTVYFLLTYKLAKSCFERRIVSLFITLSSRCIVFHCWMLRKMHSTY